MFADRLNIRGHETATEKFSFEALSTNFNWQCRCNIIIIIRSRTMFMMPLS